ncbi:pseudouridine synthase [Chitinophaga sancti]|uniref:RluA family pseudouridine synthase n=1 Tax=Chitinophaga sancti TaxID=1004 RepID=UPI002A75CA4E|nr:pseudouridine synthase [Chitinophaga sancti]WPQ66421.1 pseudouridine synthase [Chitinophaga sancti]
MGDKIDYFSDELIKDIALPERFTFPFFYEPHPLSKLAAADLQQYLETQTGLDHNFGLTDDTDGSAIGKMFGVLVVKDPTGRLGYLSAFSGKLANSNDHGKFVPPVFDMLSENSFFLKGLEFITAINARIDELNADANYLRLKLDIEQAAITALAEITHLKQQLKANKDTRKQLRTQLKERLNEAEYAIAEADIINQSLADKRQLKHLTDNWAERQAELKTQLDQFESILEPLKNERKERSADLQQQIFEQYSFLNKDGQTKSLQAIFSETPFGKPPAGSGECAMPKLLHFAFAKNYAPIAMAEFWWGTSPKSEIRKHKQFYPACTGKCKPILAHMLEGIPIDDNPLLHIKEDSHPLEIVFEDDSFVVVNKPSGLRSVPGVSIGDSVYSRLKQRLLDTEPLIIHRLDMDTSGLLVVAKTQAAHKHIQRQFLQRTVSKRYTALISKVLDQSGGMIDLPLGPDLLNRPRQLVCFETGKKSVTKWEVVKRFPDMTKVNFWPLTGRTHQLRMHSAHASGLNAPIVGDDLYGTASERMYLHAAEIEFIHPATREKVRFAVEEGF